MSPTAHAVVAVIALASVTFIANLVRSGRLRAKYAMLWLSIGLVMVVLAAFPGLLDRASARIGIAYPPATLFVVAITLLLLICVHFSYELSRLEERVRTLAEELALRDADAPPPRELR